MHVAVRVWPTDEGGGRGGRKGGERVKRTLLSRPIGQYDIWISKTVATELDRRPTRGIDRTERETPYVK